MSSKEDGPQMDNSGVANSSLVPPKVGNSLRELPIPRSTVNDTASTQPASLRSRLAIAAVTLLLAANVVVPLLWGDVYPFTSAPMFRDAPRVFCNYRVYSPAGEELPLTNWNLQRIYDGNPVGYGVGVRPPPVVEQRFGVIHDETAVRQHVERQFQRADNSQYEFVDVVQDVIGPLDPRSVGIVKTNRWRISRPPSP